MAQIRRIRSGCRPSPASDTIIHPGDPMPAAHTVLVLALQAQGLRSPVVAWSVYGPTDGESSSSGCDEKPPYATAIEALRDGWRLVQYTRQPDPPPGAELRPGSISVECVLEKETVRA
jgi:hypothetical protein